MNIQQLDGLKKSIKNSKCAYEIDLYSELNDKFIVDRCYDNFFRNVKSNCDLKIILILLQINMTINE